ncbi:MAG: D-alanyl-D-alanine carboxypeptidase [Fimbriimonadaceae bacterium]|nr:D-alanyl-D-alanine carboxypeptidase [Alphaproteobacteria bacterium]
MIAIKPLRFLLLTVLLYGCTLFPLQAQTIDTKAPFAILIDAATGTVLFENNSNELMPPASLSKLMTIELVFHALKEGRLSPDDAFFVSENAWRKGGANSGGSTMFAVLDSEIKLIDLIRGVIIQSGNDACIVIAEGMAGSEEAFARLMNTRASELGLSNSHFMNSTGLPDPNHLMTARDLGFLARHIISTYPDLYKIYAEQEFTWNDIQQFNRNPLLRSVTGADGLKTGYTREAGFSLVGSVLRADLRLIVVVSGLQSRREREEEARKLLEWGFRNFEQITLFDADEEVGTARVYGGDKWSVKLVGDGAVQILLPRDARGKLRADVRYMGPLIPPIEEGDRVASLQVTSENGISLAVPLYAGEDVRVGPLHRRAMDAVLDLMTRWW